MGPLQPSVRFQVLSMALTVPAKSLPVIRIDTTLRPGATM